MKYKINLCDAFKSYTHDQDKILHPKETIKRFKNKLKNIDLDIFKTATRIDNGRLDIPVFFSVCGKDAQKIIGTQKQILFPEPEPVETITFLFFLQTFSMASD